MPQSTERFRHEDIASVPAGWKVRTVTTSGGHRVRVAFPPGRKVKGSGRLVSILHPLTGPNPCGNPCTVRSSNPQELIVMGANPPRRRKNAPELSEQERYELSQLWHTARIAGFNKFGERITWAAKQWERSHPGQRMRAYKWLSLEMRGYGEGGSGRMNPIPANPFFSEKMDQGNNRAVIWAGTQAGPFHVNLYSEHVDLGEKGKGYSTIERARKVAQKWLDEQKKHGRNPHELLIMGANPLRPISRARSIPEFLNECDKLRNIYRRRNTISEEPDPRYPGEMRFVEWRRNMLHFINSHWYAGATSAGRTMSDAEYAHIARITHMPPGEYDWSFIRDAEDHEVKEVYEYLKARHPEEGPYKGLSSISTNPRVEVVHGQNPPVEAIHEEFTGQEVKWIDVYDEPHMTAGRYAELGSLIALYVKPVKGGQVLRIGAPENHDDFAEWWDHKPPLLVTDSSARQIYFVNGCQDLSNLLEQFGAVADGNIYMLGQVRRIDYECRKEHVADPDEDRWKHDHGEEDGELPTLVFDDSAKRMSYRGGNYRIEGPWIKN